MRGLRDQMAFTAVKRNVSQPAAASVAVALSRTRRQPPRGLTLKD